MSGLDDRLRRIAGLRPKAPEPAVQASASAPISPLGAGREVKVEPLPPVIVSRFPIAHHHGHFALGALLDDPPDTVEPLAHDLDVRRVPARDIAFFDTETSGLSGGAGCRVFLVGLGFFARDEFVVEQHLMQGLECELEFLERVRAVFARFSGVATFFGKSFDRPRLEDRYSFYGIRDKVPDRPHVDLHTLARRLWADRLPNCKLQTVERHVLGFRREDDLPSAACPEAWRSFLDGDQFLMRGVLEHNRDDILSLAVLAHAAGRAVRNPTTSRAVRVVADGLDRLGRRPEAKALLTDHFSDADPSTASVGVGLGRLLKREGAVDEAAEIWRVMAAWPEAGTTPDLELAMFYEHRRRDPQRALHHAERALRRCAAGEIAGLERRVHRLRSKLGRVEESTADAEGSAFDDDRAADPATADPVDDGPPGEVRPAAGESWTARLPLAGRRRQDGDASGVDAETPGTE